MRFLLTLVISFFVILSNNVCNAAYSHSLKDNHAKLFYFIKNSKEQQLKELINRGANIEARNDDGETPFLYAARCGNWRMARVLFEAGANLNARCNANRNALMYAMAGSASYEVAELLAKNFHDYKQVDKDGKSILHCAADSWSLEKLELAVKLFDNIDHKDNFGNTAFSLSRGKNAQLLLALGANPFTVNNFGLDLAAKGKILQRLVDPFDYRWFVPKEYITKTQEKTSKNDLSPNEKVFSEVRTGKISIDGLKKYIALGGDLNKPIETGELLLNIAASRYNDKEKCVEFLLANGANPNKTDSNGQTALFHAAKCGNSGNIITLIKHGCSVNALDKFGQTPLFYASADGNVDIAKYLIAKGADVNAVSKFGETPLMWASFGDGNNRRNKKASPVVSLLISNGADINHISNAGLTPLWASVFTDDFPTAKMLIKRGARIEYETHHRIIDESMNHVNFITFLLNNGLNPNVIVSADSHWSDPRYSSGNVKQKIDAPILYWATQKNHEEIVKLLLSKGADLNSRAANGETSLITAIDKNNEKIANTLITAGADLTITRNDGQTPLIRAAKKGRKKLVKRLIAAGATITPEEFNQFIEIDHNVNRMKKDGIYADLQSATLLHPTMAKMWGVNQDGTASDEHLRVDDLDERASSMTMLELSSYLQSKSFSKEQLNRALHFAAERNSDPNVLKLLSDKGGNVNDSEKPQILGAYNPVIFSAVIGNKLKNIEMLISLGANIHSLDNQEEGTLLHLAASLGYVDIVKLLLKYGCNKNIEDRFGSKAIDIARDNKYEEIVKILSK